MNRKGGRERGVRELAGEKGTCMWLLDRSSTRRLVLGTCTRPSQAPRRLRPGGGTARPAPKIAGVVGHSKGGAFAHCKGGVFGQHSHAIIYRQSIERASKHVRGTQGRVMRTWVRSNMCAAPAPTPASTLPLPPARCLRDNTRSRASQRISATTRRGVGILATTRHTTSRGARRV